MSHDDRVTGAGQREEEIPADLKDKRRLSADESFRFACHAGLPCFNTCCSDVNIILTPLDVLRLSRRMGMSTTQLIAEHTLKPITKDLKLPILLLKMSDSEDRACPFVGEQGCTVYADRPWSCRMYPLAMAVPPARAGAEEPEPLYFLLEDDFCKGHGESQKWAIQSWRTDQGLDIHEDLEASFREIHAHPWFIGGVRHLTPAGMEMYFMATYDLDTFRRFVLESTFTQRFEVDDHLIEKLRTDDHELVRFSARWLRYALFQEPTMRVREDAPQARRKR